MNIPRRTLLERWFRWLLLLVVVAVVATVAGYVVVYRRNFERSVRDQLNAMADGKAARIEAWRRERMADGALAAHAPWAAVAFGVPPSEERNLVPDRELAGWLESLRAHADALAVLLLDREGRVLRASEGGAGVYDAALQASVRDAVQRRRTVLCDLHLAPDTMRPVTGVAAPVLGRGMAESVGAVCIVLDPELSLYSLLRSWPSPSTTAETLLVRREGTDLVCLNDIRHRPGSALTLRWRADTRGPGAGIVDGPDYRGVNVLGAMREIAESAWFVMVKIDRDEIYAPLRAYERLLGALLGALLVAVGITGWAYRRQAMALRLRHQLAEERERNLLAQRVALLTQHANDIILLTDRDGAILDGNDRALEAYGYSRAELQRLTLRDLQAPEVEPGGADAAGPAGTLADQVRETMHRRRDGSAFPVEASGQTIEIEGVRYGQSIIRDISQRRAYEREIARLTRFYAVLSQVNQAVALARTEAELFARVCRVAVELGQFKLAWIGRCDSASREVRPIAQAGEAAGYLQEIRVTADDRPEGRGPVGTAVREGRPVVVNAFAEDASTAPWHTAAVKFGVEACGAFPIRVGGQVAGVLAIYTGETGVFGKRETALLTEVAGDISFGLDNLHQEALRREAEVAVRASELRLRTVIEQAPDAIFVHQGTRFVFVNAAAVRLLGAQSARDLIGTPLLARVHPDARELVRERIRQGLEERRSTPSHEHLYLRMDGSPVAVEVTAAPLVFEGEAAVVVFLRDVTERRRAQERLAEQGALLDLANDAMLVCTLDWRITYWNKGAERLYGWTAAEVGQRTMAELTEVDAATLEAGYARVLETGDWTGEIRQFTKTRQPVTVLSRWTLVRDGAGRPKAIFAIDTDITEKKRLETLFLRAQRLESVGHLASGIAHDLNNVLAPVIMGTTMLRDETTDPDTAAVLAMIEASAKRGADIVHQILVFSRGEHGEKRRLPLQPLLREIAQIISNTFPKSIVLETHFPPDLWTVHGDPTQLHQLLMNLCVNARDAMAAGGTLRLVAENIVVDAGEAARIPGARAGEFVRWTVSDTGSGIPAPDLDRIFDPFFTTKSKDQGTGLGLSTSLGIVHSHQGFITVESTLGRGTAFRVYLPAMKAADDDPAPRRAEVADRPGGGETILVVDDEENVRLMTRRLLERSGYRVLLACDGEEAVARWAAQGAEIQLVLTDMMMPRMDGAALIRHLNAVAPALRIVTMTGLDDRVAMTGEPRLNVHGQLHKPVAQDVLLRTLRTVLNREGGGRSPVSG